MELLLGSFILRLDERPHIMGILNVTPDSFWDGGRYRTVEGALEHAHRMIVDGADIIDVGGESTRPGSRAIGAEEEIERIGPIVEELVRDAAVPVSVDTRKAQVAKAVLDLGAHMVNDISGLTFDERMPEVVCRYGVPIVIMHMRGTPDNMQTFTEYDDVVSDVRRELADRVDLAERAGIAPSSIVVDPGIGFSKTAEQCVKIIARLDEFQGLGKPILLGTSRKSFIGGTLGLEAEDRLEPTIASCIVAVEKGANILRVHDVAGVSRALRMFTEIKRHEPSRKPKVLD